MHFQPPNPNCHLAGIPVQPVVIVQPLVPVVPVVPVVAVVPLVPLVSVPSFQQVQSVVPAQPLRAVQIVIPARLSGRPTYSSVPTQSLMSVQSLVQSVNTTVPVFTQVVPVIASPPSLLSPVNVTPRASLVAYPAGSQTTSFTSPQRPTLSRLKSLTDSDLLPSTTPLSPSSSSPSPKSRVLRDQRLPTASPRASYERPALQANSFSEQKPTPIAKPRPSNGRPPSRFPPPAGSLGEGGVRLPQPKKTNEPEAATAKPKLFSSPRPTPAPMPRPLTASPSGVWRAGARPIPPPEATKNTTVQRHSFGEKHTQMSARATPPYEAHIPLLPQRKSINQQRPPSQQSASFNPQSSSQSEPPVSGGTPRSLASTDPPSRPPPMPPAFTATTDARSSNLRPASSRPESKSLHDLPLPKTERASSGPHPLKVQQSYSAQATSPLFPNQSKSSRNSQTVEPMFNSHPQATIQASVSGPVTARPAYGRPALDHQARSYSIQPHPTIEASLSGPMMRAGWLPSKSFTNHQHPSLPPTQTRLYNETPPLLPMAKSGGHPLPWLLPPSRSFNSQQHVQASYSGRSHPSVQQSVSAQPKLEQSRSFEESLSVVPSRAIRQSKSFDHSLSAAKSNSTEAKPLEVIYSKSYFRTLHAEKLKRHQQEVFDKHDYEMRGHILRALAYSDSIDYDNLDKVTARRHPMSKQMSKEGLVMLV
eukprot:Platyproteum_vivax@DN6921_c0_g1_i2.p1